METVMDFTDMNPTRKQCHEPGNPLQKKEVNLDKSLS